MPPVSSPRDSDGEHSALLPNTKDRKKNQPTDGAVSGRWSFANKSSVMPPGAGRERKGGNVWVSPPQQLPFLLQTGRKGNTYWNKVWNVSRSANST